MIFLQPTETCIIPICRQYSSSEIKKIEDHIAKIPQTSVRLNKAMQAYLKNAKEHGKIIVIFFFFFISR